MIFCYFNTKFFEKKLIWGQTHCCCLTVCIISRSGWMKSSPRQLWLTFNHKQNILAYIIAIQGMFWTFNFYTFLCNVNKQPENGASCQNILEVELGFLDNETSWIASNITMSVWRPGYLFNSSRTKTDDKTHLSLKALFFEYLWSEPSSMMNLIFSKNEAVGAGGCLWRRMLTGLGTV